MVGRSGGGQRFRCYSLKEPPFLDGLSLVPLLLLLILDETLLQGLECGERLFHLQIKGGEVGTRCGLPVLEGCDLFLQEVMLLLKAVHPRGEGGELLLEVAQDLVDEEVLGIR